MTMTREEIVSNLETLIKEMKAGGFVEQTQEREHKPLYQAALEALQSIGHPAKAKDVMKVLRKEHPERRNLTPILTYQALEYSKRHKKTVKRSNGGYWKTVSQRGV